MEKRGSIRWVKTLMTLFVIMGKSTKLLKAVKLLKFSKAFLTFVTMALSAFVYGFFLGPWFSIGFVLMLFIHEMGHVAALKIKKLPASAPVFIPMLGAVVFSPPFKNKGEEAFVGYGGPLVGSIAAAGLFGVWWILPNRPDILLLISYTAAFVNLFNAIPIRPLDGGRVTQVIGDWFMYVGLLVLLVLTLYIQEPGMLLIWILVLGDVKILQPRIRFGIGVICQISMVVLIWLGFSGQPWWLDAYDIVMATLFNGLLFVTARKWIPDEKDVSTPAPGRVRILWFVRYLVLVGAVVLMMVLQVPHLPHQIK
jgi:Zn-dependent protease